MASTRTSCALLLTALSLATGCNQAVAAEAVKTEQAAHPATSAGSAAHSAPVSGGTPKYAVPFAWESSPTEPLSVARAFLGDALRDNRAHASHGPKAFQEYRDTQKPRATVLTCADSRVHTSAFDGTPENDVFMIRNIGNQLGNAEGSVEYGVVHLETPVLFVMGHTGCGAVKAALGDLSKQSPAVQGELKGMKFPKAAGTDEKEIWNAAVIANVRAQVRQAAALFGERVQQGKLTVVGGVYDFRNDLGHGAGKLTIVDVNGNDEPERMKAFVDALSSSGGGGMPSPRAAAGATPAWSPRDLARALEELDSRQPKAKAAQAKPQAH